jgi:hypothetical protein
VSFSSISPEAGSLPKCSNLENGNIPVRTWCEVKMSSGQVGKTSEMYHVQELGTIES